MDTDGLPGADLVLRGIDDLRAGRETAPSLLVSIGWPKLTQLGLDLPPPFADPERRLYELLSAAEGDAAHGRYNSLIRRLVSFERARACAG